MLRLMQKIVREHSQTLVMVTHDNHLATYADRIFHIIDGKIVKIEDNRRRAGRDAEECADPGKDEECADPAGNEAGGSPVESTDREEVR